MHVSPLKRGGDCQCDWNRPYKIKSQQNICPPETLRNWAIIAQRQKVNDERGKEVKKVGEKLFGLVERMRKDEAPPIPPCR